MLSLLALGVHRGSSEGGDWDARERGTVVGRAAELRVLADFLAVGKSTAQALLLDGEAGIGKTTLFEATLAEAREQGFAVFSCRPAGVWGTQTRFGLQIHRFANRNRVYAPHRQPTATVPERMVRRGSTVRVRQRALLRSRSSSGFSRSDVCAGDNGTRDMEPFWNQPGRQTDACDAVPLMRFRNTPRSVPDERSRTTGGTAPPSPNARGKLH